MKKKKMMLIVIGTITMFLGIVIFVFYKTYLTKDFRKLQTTAWIRMREKYETTKDVEFPGDPLPSSSIIFYKDRLNVCNVSEDEDNNDGMDCTDYDYSWKEGEITVKVKEGKKKKKIVYTYFFNEDSELVLTYSGDGFDYRFYYAEAVG